MEQCVSWEGGLGPESCHGGRWERNLWWVGERLAAEQGPRGGLQQPEACTRNQSPNMLPNSPVTLVLTNDRMSKMKNNSFSGLDRLERPLRSMLTSGGHIGSHDPQPQVEA